MYTDVCWWKPVVWGLIVQPEGFNLVALFAVWGLTPLPTVPMVPSPEAVGFDLQRE